MIAGCAPELPAAPARPISFEAKFMFQNLRLWAKAMLAMGFSIFVVGSLLTVSNLRTMEELIRKAEQNELDAHLKAITNSIAAENRIAETMSALVGAIPLVQEKFDAGDRAALSGLFLPGFKLLARDYNVEQFQFHLPPATSFLRLHKPEKFGDDLSSFRHTVIATNKSQKPTRGLEGGVAGLGARGMVPVSHKGRHVGSVEFGMTFGQAFFDNFKKQNGVDVSLDLADGEGFKTLASTLGKEPLLPAAVLRRAMLEAPQLDHRDIGGVPHAIYVAAVSDFSGKPIGVVEIAMDNSGYLASLAQARHSALLVGLLSLVIGLALAMLAARHLVKRIDAVAAGVNRVAQGDLTVDIKDSGKDEIGELAEAARQMRRQLHDLASRVGGHAHGVHGASREIAGAVESQAATSSQMSSSVAEITSTMEELSASSTQIAEHSKAVVDIANQTWENSKKGSEAMQSVLNRMSDIRGDNQNSLAEIVELGAKSKEISKVMEIINAIADQTKLIAFNAALEASSAGEAGKRFSVVAQEIRRLADSVTDSTGEIENKVQEIQDSISRLVITSEKGAATIHAGMDASANSAQRLGELVSAASQTSSAAQQISLSTQQQKTASNQVVVALREIVTASSHTAQSIGRISQVSQEMTAMSAELSELVQQFKLAERAA
jgi:methyl-accepting chemotaxis protein